tara:strand:+ start:1550 stop:2887 length:1338 start_codon:yes stop_codon:yes gene_type:complete
MENKELSFFGIIDLVLNKKLIVLIITLLVIAVFWIININQKNDFTSSITVSVRDELALSADVGNILSNIKNTRPTKKAMRDQTKIIIEDSSEHLFEESISLEYYLNELYSDLVTEKTNEDTITKFFIETKDNLQSGPKLLLESFKKNLSDNDIFTQSLPEQKKSLKANYLKLLKIAENRSGDSLDISIRSSDLPILHKNLFENLFYNSQQAVKQDLISITNSDIQSAKYVLDKLEKDLVSVLNEVIDQHEYFENKNKELYLNAKDNSLTILNENLKIAKDLDKLPDLSGFNIDNSFKNSSLIVSNFTGYGSIFALGTELIKQEIENIEQRTNENAYPAKTDYDGSFAFLLRTRATDAKDKLDNLDTFIMESNQYAIYDSLNKVRSSFENNEYDFVEYNIDLISVKNNNVPLINHIVIGFVLGIILSISYVFIGYSRNKYIKDKID